MAATLEQIVNHPIAKALATGMLALVLFIAVDIRNETKENTKQTNALIENLAAFQASTEEKLVSSERIMSSSLNSFDKRITRLEDIQDQKKTSLERVEFKKVD